MDDTYDGVSNINDLHDAVLSYIFSLVVDVRARNCLSLVCRKFLALERFTRTSLTLRGNARNFLSIPTSFRRVTDLDLSLLSPWGNDLLSPSAPDPYLLAHRLRAAFPLVTSLTIYARSPATLEIFLPQWPKLRHVKLVRWHQRPQVQVGADFTALFELCPSIQSLDVSSFYYYTEDLPAVLEFHATAAAALTRLDVLTSSFSEGFKAHEMRILTGACPNLKELLAACTFDPRYIGFVGDQALLDIAANCPKLTLLHLADTASLSNARTNTADQSEDAGITSQGLIDVFSKLPLLEELVLDTCQNVKDSGTALEKLNSKCKNLKKLKLGHFHSVVLAIESRLDGLAFCQGLTSLSIKHCPDLCDMGLIAIGRGCTRLVKFEIHGCNNVTRNGMRTVTSLRQRTLTEVRISCCKKLGARASIQAMDPIRDRIKKLHIDCVWDDMEEMEKEEEEEEGPGFNLNEAAKTGLDEEKLMSLFRSRLDENSRRTKKCKFALGVDVHSNGESFGRKSWDNLKQLSLWIGVGDLLTPLPMAGLEDCPNLEEIQIRIEGDCRGQGKPSVRAFGLSTLAQYPSLTKMQLDCGEATGYALTAPSGQMDLSLWERFFLGGIGDLSLTELDYWPPQDRDVNQRSLSLPAAGLLSECLSIRKLFIHGTAHEHFMNFLLKITNLRDVQLREDYYPAPENEMSSEMRADSCSRFEDALNRRIIFD